MAEPTIQQIADDVEVLIAIEQLSGELACLRATDQEIANLRDILEEMDRNFDTVDPLEMFEIDMEFHRAIAQASHNASLAEIHNTYLARLWRARYLGAIERRSHASGKSFDQVHNQPPIGVVDSWVIL